MWLLFDTFGGLATGQVLCVKVENIKNQNKDEQNPKANCLLVVCHLQSSSLKYACFLHGPHCREFLDISCQRSALRKRGEQNALLKCQCLSFAQRFPPDLPSDLPALAAHHWPRRAVGAFPATLPHCEVCKDWQTRKIAAKVPALSSQGPGPCISHTCCVALSGGKAAGTALPNYDDNDDIVMSWILIIQNGKGMWQKPQTSFLQTQIEFQASSSFPTCAA